MSQKPVAIVTGAANNIGLACATRFANGGYTVILADIADTTEQASRLPDAVPARVDVSNM